MTSPDRSDIESDATCRSCGRIGLEMFLSLGDMPLPNAFVHPDDVGRVDERFPLDVAFCPACRLVQLVSDVPTERMFRYRYLYLSSFSDELLRHSRQHALELIETCGLGPESFVVELASNDGYLLRNFVEAGIPAIGIDPAPEPAEAARKLGVETIQEFFGHELARRLGTERRRADVIIANNVMAHVSDLNDFVGGMAELIADDGLITVENAYVRGLIDHTEFDTIYHEHVCYYSCTSVASLVERHGLHLNDVRPFPALHGGTLRWRISRIPGRSERLEAFLRDEQTCGLNDAGYYRGFGERVEQLRADLLELLHRLRKEGRSIAAYGAAAKGTVLLNYAGIGPDLIDYVVDRNVYKHGHFMPGVRIPIVGTERLIEDLPDYTLLLAWNFADEIVRQQDAYMRGGGRFIVPVPVPRVLYPEPAA